MEFDITRNIRESIITDVCTSSVDSPKCQQTGRVLIMLVETKGRIFLLIGWNVGLVGRVQALRLLGSKI